MSPFFFFFFIEDGRTVCWFWNYFCAGVWLLCSRIQRMREWALELLPRDAPGSSMCLFTCIAFNLTLSFHESNRLSCIYSLRVPWPCDMLSHQCFTTFHLPNPNPWFLYFLQFINHTQNRRSQNHQKIIKSFCAVIFFL